MTNPNVTTRVVSGIGAAIPSSPLRLPVVQLDRRTYAHTQSCIQCGLCLPTCPTYVTTGQETDSPRGRIRLIKGLADGRIDPTAAVVGHLDLCLDCHACETACPSGVAYHRLLEETRAQLIRGDDVHTLPTRSRHSRIVRLFTDHVLPYPQRLTIAVWPAIALQRLGLWPSLVGLPLDHLLPQPLLKMMRLLPWQGMSWRPRFKRFYRAHGQRKATVALFTGCVGSVLFERVNRQAIWLLQHAGCDVVVPPKQGCCGAIFHHNGQVDQARALARVNIDAFQSHDDIGPIDRGVNLVAGCGAMLKQYHDLLRDDPLYADRAAIFSDCTRDITEWWLELKPPPPPSGLGQPHHTVTYHDPCHLAHAQRVTDAPRRVLSQISDLEVIPLPESDMCCGAAGSYCLTQPQMAVKLGQRKVQHIQSTGARVCVTGNAGCALQIESEARRLGAPVQVVHPVTLLHDAYRTI